MIDQLTDHQEQLITELANPNPENCCFCRFKPSCPPYWEARDVTPQDGWPADLRGIVTEIRRLGNGLLLAKIDTGFNVARIRGLIPGRHTAIKTPGERVMALCLALDSFPGGFTENYLTTFYKIS